MTGVLCSEAASVVTCIGEAEVSRVPTCIGEALATGNPLLKLGAQLAAVATLCTLVPGMVPGLVLPWGIGKVTSEAAGVVPIGMPSWRHLAVVEGLLSVVLELAFGSQSGCWLGHPVA